MTLVKVLKMLQTVMGAYFVLSQCAHAEQDGGEANRSMTAVFAAQHAPSSIDTMTVAPIKRL